MADQSPTVRQWAACEVATDEQGEWFMIAQDGSFHEVVVTEALGVFVLSLLDGRGLEEHEGTCEIAAIYDPPFFIVPVQWILEHISDEDKRIRVFFGGRPIPAHLNLTFNQYTACRSSATG